MPIYTVYHSESSPGSPPFPTLSEKIAVGLTNLHSNVTSASPDVVKVYINSLDRNSFFSGGKSATNCVRITGHIREGRSKEQKRALLKGMQDVMCEVFGQEEAVKWEIASQIVEFDDRETVMVNGVMNS